MLFPDRKVLAWCFGALGWIAFAVRGEKTQHMGVVAITTYHHSVVWSQHPFSCCYLYPFVVLFICGGYLPSYSVWMGLIMAVTSESDSRRARRMWVRDMIDRRQQQHGEYHHLVQELQAYFRLTKEQLDPLLQEASTISRAQTNFRSAHRAPVLQCPPSTQWWHQPLSEAALSTKGAQSGHTKKLGQLWKTTGCTAFFSRWPHAAACALSS